MHTCIHIYKHMIPRACSGQIELEPSVSEMAEFLCSYLQQLAGEFASWEHIPGLLGHADRNPPQAMNSILLTDEDANKVVEERDTTTRGLAINALVETHRAEQRTKQESFMFRQYIYGSRNRVPSQ